MQLRHLAAWLAVASLVGGGAALLRAQPAAEPPGRASKEQADRIRSRIIELRTDVEMLRFDYELERDELLEDLKIARGLELAGGFMAFGAALQPGVNAAGDKPPGEAPPLSPEQARKEAAEKAKAAESEKQDQAKRAAFIEERKKELCRRYALLSAKRLDLEDAERSYLYGTP